MGSKLIDLTGKRFSRWLVLRMAPRDQRKATIYECVCDCGAIATVISQHLRSGKSKSCGCLRHEVSPRLTHGATVGGKRTSEYSTWDDMIGRCHRPNFKDYRNYGGRGITVCNRWRFGENGLSGFESFLLDMGLKPHSGLTIDRTDNDLGYSHDNCSWRSRKEQGRNRRTTLFIEYNGMRMPLATAADLAGISYQEGRKRWRAVAFTKDHSS